MRYRQQMQIKQTTEDVNGADNPDTADTDTDRVDNPDTGTERGKGSDGDSKTKGPNKIVSFSINNITGHSYQFHTTYNRKDKIDKKLIRT